MSALVPPPSERLNTIIVYVLGLVMVTSLLIYAGIRWRHEVPDGQLLGVVQFIAGGLVGFIARGIAPHTGGGATQQIDAPNAETLNVSQPQAAQTGGNGDAGTISTDGDGPGAAAGP